MFDNNGRWHEPKGTSTGGQFSSSDGMGGTHKATEAEKERLRQMGIEEPIKDMQKRKVGEYVWLFREGKSVDNEIVISEVGEKERREIERLTGEKLTATKHVLAYDELRHIEKRHGINGEHDHSMADISRYEQIVEVLQNPDSVDYCVNKRGERVFSSQYRDKENKPAKMITFTKTYDGYEQMVVEAVYDSKRGKLHIITSYTKKQESRK